MAKVDWLLSEGSWNEFNESNWLIYLNINYDFSLGIHGEVFNWFIR